MCARTRRRRSSARALKPSDPPCCPSPAKKGERSRVRSWEEELQSKLALPCPALLPFANQSRRVGAVHFEVQRLHPNRQTLPSHLPFAHPSLSVFCDLAVRMQGSTEASTSKLPAAISPTSSSTSTTTSLPASPPTPTKGKGKSKEQSWHQIVSSGVAGGIAGCVAKTSVGEQAFVSPVPSIRSSSLARPAPARRADAIPEQSSSRLVVLTARRHRRCDVHVYSPSRQS